MNPCEFTMLQPVREVRARARALRHVQHFRAVRRPKMAVRGYGALDFHEPDLDLPAVAPDRHQIHGSQRSCAANDHPAVRFQHLAYLPFPLDAPAHPFRLIASEQRKKATPTHSTDTRDVADATHTITHAAMKIRG